LVKKKKTETVRRKPKSRSSKLSNAAQLGVVRKKRC